MHNYTLRQEVSNFGSDERAKQKKLKKPKQKKKKKKKKKKGDEENPAVCTSVRIYTHLHAFVCICMHRTLLGFVSPLRWKHCESPFSLASVIVVRHGLVTGYQPRGMTRYIRLQYT